MAVQCTLQERKQYNTIQVTPSSVFRELFLESFLNRMMPDSSQAASKTFGRILIS